nr:MAG TPA: hypothetical protein [Caudoviricetes sp.]
MIFYVVCLPVPCLLSWPHPGRCRHGGRNRGQVIAR